MVATPFSDGWQEMFKLQLKSHACHEEAAVCRTRD